MQTIYFLLLRPSSWFCVFLLLFAGVCLTSDIDLLLFHMNNARYLRELDFARADFYKRTGLFLKIKSKGGAVVQGAATIRYRKFIRPFTIFKVQSKVRKNEGKFLGGISGFVLRVQWWVDREIFHRRGSCPKLSNNKKMGFF